MPQIVMDWDISFIFTHELHDEWITTCFNVQRISGSNLLVDSSYRSFTLSFEELPVEVERAEAPSIGLK